MTPELEKEIRILGLLDQLAHELGNDPVLADKMALRMETSAGGRKLRDTLIRRRSEQSYYNSEYAAALKPYLDNIEEANPVIFSKASFGGKVAIRTIYLRVYQAWLFLMDHDADALKYRGLKDRYEITQNPHDVRIRKKERMPVTLPAKIQAEQHDDIRALQERIDEFLTKEMETEMQVFEQNKLSLSEESIDIIKDSLTGLEGITFKVEKNLVKILRQKLS